MQVKFKVLQEQYITLITPIEQAKKIDPEKLFPESPLCQFCKNKLSGKVVRRPDGYWCCAECSIKVFHTVAK